MKTTSIGVYFLKFNNSVETKPTYNRYFLLQFSMQKLFTFLNMLSTFIRITFQDFKEKLLEES